MKRFSKSFQLQTPVPYGLEVSTASQSRVNASGRPLAEFDDTFHRVEHLGWDQFKGLTTDYEESLYTTIIDRNHPLYKEKAARAEKIALEIEASSSHARQAVRNKDVSDKDAANRKYVQPCLDHEFTLTISAPVLQ